MQRNVLSFSLLFFYLSVSISISLSPSSFKQSPGIEPGKDSPDCLALESALCLLAGAHLRVDRVPAPQLIPQKPPTPPVTLEAHVPVPAAVPGLGPPST